MSNELFRQLSPGSPELEPVIAGLFGEYHARYGDFFARDGETELTEWYLPPQGVFVVLERGREIIAMGAYKAFDAQTAELKRIWTRSDLRRQGLAQKVLTELEQRARQAGYRQIYLTTGFRQPEAVQLYLSHDYQPQFDTTRATEEYSQPPFDGRLRFSKSLYQTVTTGAANENS